LNADELLTFLKQATSTIDANINKPPPERSAVKEKLRQEEEERKKKEEEESAKNKPPPEIVLDHDPRDDLYENTVNNLRKKYMTRHSSEEDFKPYEPVADIPTP
jgi:vacuolar-type H+-ATPase subunit I/STV1